MSSQIVRAVVLNRRFDAGPCIRLIMKHGLAADRAHLAHSTWRIMIPLPKARVGVMSLGAISLPHTVQLGTGRRANNSK